MSMTTTDSQFSYMKQLGLQQRCQVIGGSFL
jgi:hypothetical protein